MQIPAPFDYVRATSVANALDLLERHGPESRVIAGGHSLLPMMKLRLARPEWLIDINDLAELRLHHARTATGCAIGALTRHATLLASDVVGRLFPIVHDAEKVIADPVVRNRGTIGGSLCQADPAEDLTTVCDVLGAADRRSAAPGGERIVGDAPSSTAGPYETACRAGRAAHRDPAPDPAAHGQRLREGRAPGRRLGGRRGRRGRLAGRATARSPTSRIGLTAVGLEGAGHGRRAGRCCAASGPDEDLFAEAGRLAAEACAPDRATSAGRSTTSGTSPTSSPAGSCAGPRARRGRRGRREEADACRSP